MEWNILWVLTTQRFGLMNAVGPHYRREMFESRMSSRWWLHCHKHPWDTNCRNWFLWMWKIQPRPRYLTTSSLSVSCNNQVSQDSCYFWLSWDFQKTLLCFKNFCFWILPHCKSVNRWHWGQKPQRLVCLVHFQVFPNIKLLLIIQNKYMSFIRMVHEWRHLKMIETFWERTRPCRG